MKRYISVRNWRLQYLPPSEYHWWQKVTVLLTKQLISNRNGTYININLIYTPFWLPIPTFAHLELSCLALLASSKLLWNCLSLQYAADLLVKRMWLEGSSWMASVYNWTALRKSPPFTASELSRIFCRYKVWLVPLGPQEDDWLSDEEEAGCLGLVTATWLVYIWEVSTLWCSVRCVMGEGGSLGDGGPFPLGDGGPLMACERWNGWAEELWAGASSPVCKSTWKTVTIHKLNLDTSFQQEWSKECPDCWNTSHSKVTL